MDKITEIRIEEVKDYENNEFTISLETNYNNWLKRTTKWYLYNCNFKGEM